MVNRERFPPTLGDVDVKELVDQTFDCPVWRVLFNAEPAAAAVDVHSAVEFAAAMQTMVSGWTKCTNRITVDPQAACVSFQQETVCIIFSVGGGPRVQFVQVKGLPPSFIDVQQAQEVRGNAREMNPPEPPPALPPQGRFPRQ